MKTKSQDKFNRRLDTTKEKMSKLGEIAKETIQTETCRTKKNNMKKALVTHGTKVKWANAYKMKVPEKGNRESI